MDWNSSLLWGIIGLVGGFLVSLFFYFISQKRKFLVYDITTTTLISENATQIKNLSIKYNENPIKNLNISTVKIKNNGNSIIERNDFAPSAPLSLVTNGEFLINSDTGTKLFTENEFNNVYPILEFENGNICKKAIIQFDYFSKKETISCNIFHTGSLSINGKLKDGELFSKKDYNLRSLSYAITCGTTFILIVALVGFILGQYSAHQMIKHYTQEIIVDYSNSISQYLK